MLPELRTAIPGPRSLELAQRLGRVECRSVTFTSGNWPVFWERAEDTNVWDADGNRFLDLTSAFGVTGLGHSATAEALRQQSYQLLHGMGDVHPAVGKVELCEMLSSMTFERWGAGQGKVLLGNSGFEAVEAALKTAMLATGRGGILAFEGAYHGLGYGALLGAGISWFREPFENQIAKVSQRLRFPQEGEDLTSWQQELEEIDASGIGAVLVEPIQGRGGFVVPPLGFLRVLREWCDTHDVVLIFDEIFTGFWRTGKCFACEYEGVVPDLICLGKALSGGFPISACVGRAEVMDRWPQSHGEALHTSTFLGNPLGCAMAIESLKAMRDPATEVLVTRTAAALRAMLEKITHPAITGICGRGMLLGLRFRDHDGVTAGDRVVGLMNALLQYGVIILPEGPKADVLGFSPPFALSDEEVEWVGKALRDLL